MVKIRRKRRNTLLTRKFVITFFLTIFLTVCIFFPGDPFKLKLFTLIPVLLFGLKDIVRKLLSRKYSYVTFMGVGFFAFIVLLSFLNTFDLINSVLGGYSSLLILLVIIVNENKIEYTKILITLLKVLALFLVGICLLDIIGLINVNSGFLHEFFYKYDVGFIGKSPEYSLYYKVFAKSSPLLIILLGYCLHNKKWFFSIVALAALAISGTRANFFAGIILMVIGVFLVLKNSKKHPYAPYVFLASIVLIALSFSGRIFNYLYGIMNSTGAVSSDDIRFGQLQSFFNEFSKPNVLLFGSGFGSEFFDSGRGAFSSSSEISYLDLIRKIGIIAFAIFAIFVFLPLSFKRVPKIEKLGYVLYLVICLTNPLLFSSTAYILYIYMYLRKVGSKRIHLEQNIKQLSNKFKLHKRRIKFI